ncbi:MAG TPA: BREX system ATP-binding domain-containing protein [Actinophytocola sp.]|uniref:BREX system ATP-binding domain-containing protein n=1 Tax=Actinophytocola sp. TaxID=1872138 RepID=UPI002DC03D86|nr:BREX system ATP-binding domain-containing protein [Actinophytocola sp.]HEU5469373.1 BREX system ATP-binding domain-containing protein [Actinophytocola sp.]
MAPNLKLPSGAPELNADEYLKQLCGQYLHSYVAAGGSAVKLVVTDSDETTAYFSRGLAEAAGDNEYLHLRLDAAQTRLQLIDELFFAVCRQIDWIALAARYLRQVYRDLDIPADESVPPAEAVPVRRVAEANGMHAGELYRTIRRTLERRLLGEPTLLRQFGTAMLRLCHSLLGWTGHDEEDRDIVLRWLSGRSVPVAQLRTVGLSSRIGRHHARYMFTSLTSWVQLTGHPGTVVELDLTRIGVARRPTAVARRGFYYTKAAALDTFEILRQFIDGVDDLFAGLLVVTVPHQMAVDGQRGLPAYHALYLRVADDVYDHGRANPLGSLVRIAR